LEEFLASKNLIPLFLNTLSDSTISPEHRRFVSFLLSRLSQTMINLNLAPLFLEMIFQGSPEFRSLCSDILLNIWARDITLLTANLQTLELVGSLIPRGGSRLALDVDRLVVCVSWMVRDVSDHQLLIDSNIFKGLLRLIDDRRVVEYLSQLLRDSIEAEVVLLIQHLVDDVGLLPLLINALQNNDPDDEMEEDLIAWAQEKAKDAVRAAMRWSKRYEKMVSHMEMPEIVRDELMREVQGKRKRSGA
jgi:hypothetical protein